MICKLVIPDRVYQKIMFWVNKADFEVSGFGTVTHDPKTKTFRIEDAFLVKQEGSAAATDICANDLGKAMFEAHKMGLKGTLNFWWHSHVNMDVFWSGTDKSTIEDLGKNGFILATVFNKKEEMRSAFCTNVDVPFLGPRVEFIDNLDTEIERFLDAEEVEQWEKDFDAKVTRKEYKPYYESTYKYDKAKPWWESDYDKYYDYNKYGDNFWRPTSPHQENLLKDEAKTLGITYEKYLNIINYGSHTELMDIEAKLEAAQKGKNGSVEINE